MSLPNGSTRLRMNLYRGELLMVFVLVLGGLIWLGPGFGPYWDSWNFYNQARRWSLWIQSFWNEMNVPPLAELRWYFPDEPRHPPLMEWGGGFFNAFYQYSLGQLGSSRLTIEVPVAIWCTVLFWYLRSYWGSLLAWTGIVLYFGSPRFCVHSVLLNIDGLVASIYGICLFSFTAWDKGWRGKFLIWFCLVVAFLTKLQAYYLAPILMLWVGWLSWGSFKDPGQIRLFLKNIFQAGMIIFFALLTMFVLWPALWLDFPRGLMDYLHFITRHSNVPVLYFGQLYVGQETPPWHYPWIFTTLAVPPVFWLPFVVRFFRLIWQGKEIRTHHPSEFLFWIATLFPLLISSLPQAPKYDGIRLLMPAYMAMCVLSAFEISYWLNSFREIVKTKISPLIFRLAMLLIFFLILLPSIQYYPFNLIYYSPLIGGPAEAQAQGFDLDYLGVSMHHLNPALNQVAEDGDILLIAGANALVYQKDREGWPAIEDKIHTMDFPMLREITFLPGRRVFAYISSRYSGLCPEAKLLLKSTSPLATVEFRGLRIFSLHEVTRQFVENLPNSLNQDFGTQLDKDAPIP